MQKNKTLIILTPGFPENEADSTCIPPQQVFVKALKHTNPDLNIILLAFQYPFIYSEYTWNGIKVISFNGRNKGKINRLIVWIHVWKTLKRIYRQDEVIGLLSFWLGECAFIGKYFAKRYNLIHYCWILGQDARKKNRYVWLMRARAEELIAMSDFLAREFYKNYGFKPKHIITNGIDITLYPKNQGERDIDVLGVGSLIPLKQYDLFVDIINTLTYTIPSVKAVICGKGPEENHLKSMIKKLKLDNNISLPGEKSHPEILQLMQKTKILLHTSSYEGFSTVCLEALGAGAHVISFCNPIEGRTNHWHIVETKEEMLQKTIEILQDPAIDHSRVIPFSMNNSAKAMIKLYIY